MPENAEGLRKAPLGKGRAKAGTAAVEKAGRKTEPRPRKRPGVKRGREKEECGKEGCGKGKGSRENGPGRESGRNPEETDARNAGAAKGTEAFARNLKIRS